MIQDIFEYNADWARRQTQSDPEYFHRLAAGQHPTYLWIGCSDSRVPANTITGLAPGEVFVHRNIANLINEADTNALAVIEFAVDVLCVKDIIVCGHYGCGGIRAAMHETGSDTIDRWLDPVRDTARRFADELLAIGDEGARLNLLCERSTEAQVERVARLDIVRKAWERGQRVAVHGWVYGLEDGRLRDLGCSQPTPAALTTLLASIASRIDDHFKTEDEDDIGEGLADPRVPTVEPARRENGGATALETRTRSVSGGRWRGARR